MGVNREGKKDEGFLNPAYVTDHLSHSVTLGANDAHLS
jgi:hypothetical protein